MRNFIWSGDINQRKLVTVAWHKVCKPYKERGLGIRNLSDINEAGNLKLCGKFTILICNGLNCLEVEC